MSRDDYSEKEEKARGNRDIVYVIFKDEFIRFFSEMMPTILFIETNDY